METTLTTARTQKIDNAYRDAQARATASLVEIKIMLARDAERHDRENGTHATHYGHVGDINHAAHVLETLADQLAGRES